MTDDESNKSEHISEQPIKQMDAEEIEADIKKHLNVDFDDEDEVNRRASMRSQREEMKGMGLG